MSQPFSKNLRLGILFALINAFMLAGMSLCAKQLSSYLGPIEITFFRSAFGVAVLFIWFAAAGKLEWLKTERPLVHLFRGFIGTTGIVLGIFALSMLPLTETTVLFFTSPLFTVLLSGPMLKEKVGRYRMSAVFFGFLGVVIVVSPFTSHESLPLLGVLIGLGWGFSSGLVDAWLRLMGRTENANTTTFYFLLFGMLTTGLHWPLATLHENSFSMPALLLILGLGTTGVIAQLAKTHSYRLGEAPVIAPVLYTMILWSMAFDYIFWGKTPGWNVIAGAAIIIGSNVFILLREAHLRRESKLNRA